MLGWRKPDATDFALFVLGSAVPEGGRIAAIAALTVFISIIVHGVTDTRGSEWMARRGEARLPARVRCSSGDQQRRATVSR